MLWELRSATQPPVKDGAGAAATRARAPRAKGRGFMRGLERRQGPSASTARSVQHVALVASTLRTRALCSRHLRRARQTLPKCGVASGHRQPTATGLQFTEIDDPGRRGAVVQRQRVVASHGAEGDQTLYVSTARAVKQAPLAAIVPLPVGMQEVAIFILNPVHAKKADPGGVVRPRLAPR